MSVAEAVLAILGSIVTVLTPAGGLGWWIYKRAWDSGYKAAEHAAAEAEDKAKVAALEQQLAETQRQLATLQQSKSVSGSS